MEYKQTAELKGWVVGRSRNGPYINTAGDVGDDLASAEIHSSEIAAKTFARRRTTQQLPGGTWRAFPLPSAPEIDADEPYDQQKADASYRALPKRPY